jgi:hypothetical protein
MGLYNFQRRFVPFILSGAKTHTIRAYRKHPDKPGNMLHLYTGLRTKQAQLLMRRPCVKVEDISISDSGDIFIDGNQLDDGEREGLARRDGFESFTDMAAFWKGRTPFHGHVIHWKGE